MPEPSESKWYMFRYGNDLVARQDFHAFRSVPGGICFRSELGRLSGVVRLVAPGYGLLCPPVDGHSLYGSGAIYIEKSVLDEAIKSGDAKEMYRQCLNPQN